MKSALIAASAAVFGVATAAHGGHAGFHHRRNPPIGTGVSYEEVCSTYTSTWYGPGGLVPTTTTVGANSTVNIVPTPVSSTSVDAGEATTTTPCSSELNATVPIIETPTPISSTKVVPTGEVTTCPTPGTYTFPAKTIVVTETTTVCDATTTELPSGTHTYGGVTTSVVQSTTITCPYATVETSGSVKTSVIKTTTFVCPSGGEYTIAPTTTVCTDSETIVFPTVTSFEPGTYTQPETTVTIVKTSQVYVCPFESSKAPEPTSAPAPTSAPVETPVSSTFVSPVETSPPVEEPVSSTAASPVESSTPVDTPSSSSTPAPSSSSRPKASSVPNAPFPTNGNQWAMTYTPYKHGAEAGCKDADSVLADLTAIKAAGFTTVRLYSPDCDGLINIGAACKELGLKILIGIYISESGLDEARNQVKLIKDWLSADGGNSALVDLVIVGNESMFNHWISAEELASFILEVKVELQGAGLSTSIPFTTTEPLNILQLEGSKLCDSIDIIGVNIQSYFTTFVLPSAAGLFVKGQMELAALVCPGKPVKNVECGWPKNGGDRAGKDEQAEALKSIVEVVGPDSAVFAGWDDAWKGPSDSIEGSWGSLDVFSS